MKHLQPWRSVLIALAAVCAAAPLSHAQTPSPEAAPRARIQLGGLALDPRLNIRDVGVDTNVFNTSTDPMRDVTFAVGPALDEWLHAGRAMVTGRSSLDWHYFREASSQRAFDASQAAAADFSLGYIVPHVAARFEQSRERPNIELDARVPRQTLVAGAGVMAKVGAKLSIDLAQERRRIVFDDLIFQSVNLDDILSRREIETTMTARYQATPLTALVARGGYEDVQFLHSPSRNATSFFVMPGIEMKPLALISGSAYVGVRRFSPRTTDIPAFEGVVADVDLSYLLRDLTRLSVSVNRDVDFSYNIDRPYFVATGVGATIMQAIGSGWDVVGRASRTRLDYRAEASAVVAADPARRDSVSVYGFGVGRHLGTDVRVGIDIDRAERRSNEAGYGYHGMRIGGSVTYGL
ncbi:MAG TPA: outer membrane beta-barrel protein [Vicinamibacterales bacterium]|nr:outer membrane beta-barrel protein [Vicinamibacterales bacterium]